MDAEQALTDLLAGRIKPGVYQLRTHGTPPTRPHPDHPHPETKHPDARAEAVRGAGVRAGVEGSEGVRSGEARPGGPVGRAWAERAAEAGWRPFDLDARRVRDKDAFLRLCAEVFDFPEWFGENWDALEDCLTDLSWAPARKGYLVVFEAWTGLADADQAGFRTVLDVFAEVVESWRDTGTPMTVLLPTAGVEVAGIPRVG